MVITPRHATPLCVRLPIGVSLQQFVGDLRQSTSLDNDGAGARQSRLTENNFRWLWIPGIGRIPNPWDAAHAVSEAAAARGYSQLYVEPDLLQTFPWTPLSLNKDKPLEFDKNWRPDKDDHVPIDWHLDSSKLRDARRLVGNPAGPRVRVGHLDTGYSAIHETKPVNLQPQLGVNLVEGGSSTVDPAELQPLGNLLFPGHGTFTIALLAGARCTLTGDNLGGAPFADVVPPRLELSSSILKFRDFRRNRGSAGGRLRHYHLEYGRGSFPQLGVCGQQGLRSRLHHLRRRGKQPRRISDSRYRVARALGSGYRSFGCDL